MFRYCHIWNWQEFFFRSWLRKLFWRLTVCWKFPIYYLIILLFFKHHSVKPCRKQTNKLSRVCFIPRCIMSMLFLSKLLLTHIFCLSNLGGTPKNISSAKSLSRPFGIYKKSIKTIFYERCPLNIISS